MRVSKEPMNMQEDKLENTEADALNEHYDFDYSKAKLNRFAARLAQEQLMVVLDPDMAAIFPTSEAVNEALRVLATAAQNLPPITPKQSRKPRKTTAISNA
jgi:hypothetical protein